ncbi:probable purine permease 11 [Magnolia sinica]|uniref:probable purine permease 11 n=1 Tax=Magnolia sinica TaxID=86752 RepID=UPI002658C797|nr:probable purine permease 11 [Magnolia sinica]XP_058104174.1 probable purine permease 11 [Magnolia sinica]XP_058104175.1 probable purine permease 11 [Magnolia sinica]
METAMEVAAQEPNSPKDAAAATQLLPSPRFKRRHWWLLVILSTIFLLSGQSVGTLLGRVYFNKGGNSKWMETLVQSAGFPILILPLILFPSSPTSSTNNTPPSFTTLAFLYTSLGLLFAADNMLYSYGLLYLPVSTYSLICASQLAFNVLFSYFLNSQKLTPLILNSVVLLTFSSSLIAVRADSKGPMKTSTGKYAAGFLCTLGASAAYSLLLSLTQLSFEKILKKENLSVVLEIQIYPAAVASLVCVVGLFASGEWKHLEGEMEGFRTGRVSYVMNLAWTAVAWQISAIGSLGLIFVVSSLFCNVIGTVALPITPVAGVILFHEKMDGVKIVAMFLAIWGFISYIYQQYVDDSELKETARTVVIEIPDVSSKETARAVVNEIPDGSGLKEVSP